MIVLVRFFVRLLPSPGGMECCRGLIAYGRMRPYRVVVVPPVFYACPGLLDGEEPVLIEALLSQPAIEGFDEGIIGGRARSADDEFHAALVCPGIHGS